MSKESEDLARAIVDWSRERPIWEQLALSMVARGEPLTDETLGSLADVAEQEAGGASSDTARLEVADLLTDDGGSGPIQLLAISEPAGVNAITWSEGIDFAPAGLTVVYGENGSGKSGYARILKTVTRARHEVEVLSNVFEAPAEQSARLTVTVGSSEQELAWPSDSPDFLSQVSFYDSDCAQRYVTKDTEVAYRPSSIALLDDLVAIAARVRLVLEERRSSSSIALPELPTVPAGTRAAEFSASISASTTSLEIDLAAELPADVDDRLEELKGRISNLAATDISKRAEDLSGLVSAVRELNVHIGQARETLSDETIRELLDASTQALVARSAADAAGAAEFASLPISGVGTASWRVLWESAKRFSEEAAYPGQHFPVIDVSSGSAHCVLCHQDLGDDAAARLTSFDEFVVADSEQVARESAATLKSLAAAHRALVVFDTDTELRLQRIESSSEGAHRELRSTLVVLEERQSLVVRALDGEEVEIGALADEVELPQSDALVNVTNAMLADLRTDDPRTQLEQLRREEAEIAGRQALRDGRAAVEGRISALQAMHVVEEAIRLTDTRGITRRAADLTRTHVSDVLKHHFSQETLMLDLRRVRLADAGGGQGNLRHRAQLVGAVQRAPLNAVLSEGEQTALGLAGFLTEVESDPTKSAVVFDDPVTSLDHVRRERMARRFVELASGRQVVVFTHDIAFIVDLKRAAEVASVDVVERWVTKAQTHVGRVSEGGPWDARMVGQRLDELNRRLADVRSTYAGGDPAACQEAARSWYQDLRVVWERALEEVVLGPVLVRGRLELRPTNLKVFVRFTEADDQEFQAAFTRCGDRGSHDRSSELNRPLPPVAELEADLDALRGWHKRVRKYVK